jgi:ABC-type nitrate/sulfonate/bicarbonate transport system ATPase subunit
MIDLRHVDKSFAGQPVLQDVSLEVVAGEILAFYGPSGCGKTTLLELIAGVTRPDRGQASVLAERIGMAFQDDCLLPWKTVAENLELGLAAFVKGEESRLAVEHWLGRFGLLDARHKRPVELSGGMRRRLNLARCFAIEPDLLLLDEPFTFLDERFVTLVQEELLALNARLKTTILLVSHVPGQAAPLRPTIIDVPGTPVHFQRKAPVFESA